MNTKSKVLKILIDADEKAVSGEILATKIGVSRNSIWKAVNSLKLDGYIIEGKQKNGYVLEKSNVISTEQIKKHLNKTEFADRITIEETVDSTNTRLKVYAAQNTRQDKNVLDKIYIANQQTHGKGRLGRSFYSPPKSGLYISFLLYPNTTAENAVLFTTAASVVVSMAIENVLGLNPKIKWVNDVYLNDKKICGILTEAATSFESGIVDSVVIGIGVNISTNGFPDEISNVAGGLSDEILPPVDIRNIIAGEIINLVDKIICDDIIINNDRKFIDEYRKRSMVIGQNIRIVKTNEVVKAIDIDNDGGLVVMNSDGTNKTLSSGEVSIRLDV